MLPTLAEPLFAVAERAGGLLRLPPRQRDQPLHDAVTALRESQRATTTPRPPQAHHTVPARTAHSARVRVNGAGAVAAAGTFESVDARVQRLGTHTVALWDLTGAAQLRSS